MILPATIAVVDAGTVWPALAATVLLGAWLALDETAVAQTWFSQPLTAGLLAGVVWGEPGLGLALGLPLQLLAVGNLPIGQPFTGEMITPLLGLTAAAAAAGWALPAPFTDAGEASARLGWLLVAAVLGSLVGDRALRWQSRLHSRLMLGGLRGLRGGRYESLERAHLRCVWATALRGALFTLAWTGLALTIWLPLFARLPGRLIAALAYLPWLAPAVAIGTLGELYGRRRGLTWVGGGLLAALALAWSLGGGGPA